MENNQELLQAIQELTAENRKQQELLQKQYRTTRLLGILLVCLLLVAGFSVITLLPKTTAAMTDLSRTLQELDVIVANTQTITAELMEADIEGTIDSLATTLDSIDDLVTNSADSLTATLQKLEAMDIETLNEAINDLHKIISPLANFFSR